MPAMLTFLRNAWRDYRALRGIRRELATLVLCLLLALLLLPAVIWVAGQAFLGDYIRDPSGTPTGGPLSLWVDILAGLVRGEPGYWIAMLGPWLLLLALRASRWFLRMGKPAANQGQ